MKQTVSVYHAAWCLIPGNWQIYGYYPEWLIPAERRTQTTSILPNVWTVYCG